MASIRIVFLCLLISSQRLDTISATKRAEVTCTKSEIETQFGSSTLLNCSVTTTEPNVKIEGVNWLFNDASILTFVEGTINRIDPRFKFAESSWDESNMNVSLLIINTDLSHTGDYHCWIRAGANDHTEVHVTVKAHYSKPIIKSDPEKITPDKDFSLTCEAHGGFPQGHIRWVVNDAEWKNKPEDEVRQTSDGLYSLTNKLHFRPGSVFTKFVCEVYNASNVMEGQSTFKMPPMRHSTGSDQTKGHSLTQIVTPVVVIGSLIVGLLVAVLVMCRRRHQNVPMDDYPEENNEMV